jgi:ATP/maltotriose-dependent transcriptional regulator MalT/DNA-binding SARP family transcriptional activator
VIVPKTVSPAGKIKPAHTAKAASRAAPQPAKIIRPRLGWHHPRLRLFGLFDAASRQPVTWIAAPPGAGKTTALTSYLEARKLKGIWYQVDAGDADPATFFHYLSMAAQHAAPRYRTPLPTLTPDRFPGIDVFTRRYFEQLCARLKAPAVLVLDNYQDVAGGDEAFFHGLVTEAAASLTAGVRLIVVSRADPPPVFARLRANGAIAVIDAEALRLTLEEAGAIARQRGNDRLSPQALENLHRQTHGWAAGTVLILEQAAQERHVLPQFDRPVGRAVFDYFAAEVLRHAPDTDRMILLKTAILPQVSASEAEALTGEKRAERVLAELARKNYFTVRLAGADPTYQYHPLFREFLLTQLGLHTTADELAALRRRAASYAEAADKADEAAALWREAGDWAALAELIVRKASTLVDQGRNRTLLAWIETLPPAALAASPWLLYWRGVCVLPYEPEAARVSLEEAFARFRTQGDRSAMLYATCAIVDTFVFQWGSFVGLDRWIAELEELLAGAVSLAVPLEPLVASTMFIALANRQPGHPQIGEWAARAWDITVNEPGSVLSVRTAPHLIIYCTWWTGDLAKAGLLLDTLRAHMQRREIPPLLRTAWRAMLSAYQWVTGATDDCIRTVEEGLAIGNETGVHLWDVLTLSQGVFASHSSGDRARAARYLEAMAERLTASRLLDMAFYHWLCAIHHLAGDDLDQAASGAETAVRMAQDSGALIHAAAMQSDLARVLFYRGETARAAELVREVRRAGHDMRSPTLEYLSWLVEAEMALERADLSGCVAALRQNLAIGRALKIHNHPSWSATMMARLYAVALDHGIETDHVRGLIRLRRISADPSAVVSNQWPFPVKLYCLGRFRVLLEDKPLASAGKAQKKALDLLKALLALGGREVTEHRLADALWPDSDAARQNLKSTLHRLRKLIGAEALSLSEGKLSLDARTCWVDVWAFERALGEAAEDPAKLLAALALYKGSFLSGEDEAYLISMRERLKARFLRAAVKAGAHLESQGRHEQAIDLYESAIRHDSLAEVYYQRVMRCYQHLGRAAEALAVYARCAQALRASLGLGPNAETEALRKNLLSQSH